MELDEADTAFIRELADCCSFGGLLELLERLSLPLSCFDEETGGLELEPAVELTCLVSAFSLLLDLLLSAF